MSDSLLDLSGPGGVHVVLGLAVKARQQCRSEFCAVGDREKKSVLEDGFGGFGHGDSLGPFIRSCRRTRGRDTVEERLKLGGQHV